MQRDTDRRACCREIISRADVLRVGPFPSVDRHIEVARGVCDIGEEGKVRPIERGTRVCLDQKAVSLLPIAPPHGFPRLVHKQCGRSSSHPRPRGGFSDRRRCDCRSSRRNRDYVTHRSQRRRNLGEE